MKKIIMILLLILSIGVEVYAADFDLGVGIPTSDKASIYIPRKDSNGNMFTIYVNNKKAFDTNWINSKIDSETITTTVNFDRPNSQYFVYAVEINPNTTNPRFSASVTFTSKPMAQEIINDRDANAYINNKMFFQAWSNSVTPPSSVVDTSWNDYGVFITEIIVGGDKKGDVALKIDNVPVRYYHYIENGTSGQIFSTKLLIQKGKSFKVDLISGQYGNHTVSITGEIVK
jgi:hypothetical protein